MPWENHPCSFAGYSKARLVHVPGKRELAQPLCAFRTLPITSSSFESLLCEKKRRDEPSARPCSGVLLCKHALCSRSFSHTDARVQGILPSRDWGLCLLTGFPSEFQVSEEMVTALATNLDWCILGTCALWEEFSDLT